MNSPTPYHPPDGDAVPDDGFSNTFILTAQSDHLTLKTAKPPSPPTNLGVVATTCGTIQVAWDAPQENGVEVIGRSTLSTLNWFMVNTGLTLVVSSLASGFL